MNDYRVVFVLACVRVCGCVCMYLSTAITLSLSFYFPQLVAISAVRDCRRVAEKVPDAYRSALNLLRRGR